MDSVGEDEQLVDDLLGYVEQVLGRDARREFALIATERAPEQFALEVSCSLSCVGAFPPGELGLWLSAAASRVADLQGP